MKLIVAGGRDHYLTVTDYERLDALAGQIHISEVVSGHCSDGADSCGEWWANLRQIPLKLFPADWSQGRKAGPIRNKQMAEYADAVVLFPGGRGTESMCREAMAAGIIIYDWRNA